MSSPPMSETTVDLTQNRGPELVALILTLSAIATLIVGVRFFARYSIRAIGLDDWLMLASLILMLIATALVVLLSSLGGLSHLAALRPHEIPHILKIFWLCQPPAIIGLAIAKASIGWLILRIIGSSQVKWQKRLIYFLMISVFILNVIACIMVIAQCKPIRALWTPGLPSKCWNPKIQANYAIFDSVWNALIDATLALLPITVIIKLKTSMKRRLGLIVILGLGLLTFICAIVKTSFVTIEADRSDITWDSYYLLVWFFIEMFLLVILGSIPPLKPLFEKWFVEPETPQFSHELPSTSKMKGPYQTHSRGIDIEGMAPI